MFGRNIIELGISIFKKDGCSTVVLFVSSFATAYSKVSASTGDL